MTSSTAGTQLRPIGAYYDILMEAIPKAGSPKSVEILTELQFFINAVALQWNRIILDSIEQTSGLRAMVDEGHGVDLKHAGQMMSKLRLDVQLLVIVLDKAMKLMKAFARAENDVQVWKQCAAVEKILASLSDARDSIEHFDYDLSSDSGRPRGLSLGPGGLMFNFTRAPRGKRKVARTGAVFLGADGVESILKSFEEIVAALKARPKSPRVS
jgi:hypothetical protein